MDAVIEEIDQRIERLEPDTGKALREHIRPQRHRRAHHWNGKRVADAGGVTAYQIHLQLGERLGGDADFGKAAEAGVDPIGGLIAARKRVDDSARGRDTGTRLAGQ
jgi:hypothetical protein